MRNEQSKKNLCPFIVIFKACVRYFLSMFYFHQMIAL